VAELEAPDAELVAFALRAGLVAPGAAATWSPLTGGVSSDIWRLESAGRAFCLKRALPKLRVAAEWRAPVERNLSEWHWLETVGAIAQGAVPRLHAVDPRLGVFAMQFLPARSHPQWKALLLAGQVELPVAAAVGAILGRVHRATAGDAALAARFATDALFHALRLEPYLLATAERHPQAAPALRALALRTASRRTALVHGDVSPKNILCGPQGPVFLDAECAWYGDPAFDLAFCLNHLLLKCVAVPARRAALLASFDALAQAYLAEVVWEPAAELEARAATLLPGLLLARVDGKSPVEYLRSAAQQESVRAVALELLRAQPARLASVREAWARAQ